MRSLLLKLDAWVARQCARRPPSVYPTLADGTLVARSQLRFPDDSRRRRAASRRAGRVRLDFGPSFAADGIATIEPPRVGAPFPVLLPQVDADGNEIAGLRSPELAVPLATYMGWQLYKPELGRDDELVSLQGSFVPFPLDAAERARTGDPRRAILERYPDRERYLALVEQVAKLADRGRLSARRGSSAHRRAGRRALARARRGTRAALEPAADTERVVAPRQRRDVLHERRVLARFLVAEVAGVDEQLELHAGTPTAASAHPRSSACSPSVSRLERRDVVLIVVARGLETDEQPLVVILEPPAEAQRRQPRQRLAARELAAHVVGEHAQVDLAVRPSASGTNSSASRPSKSASACRVDEDRQLFDGIDLARVGQDR